MARVLREVSFNALHILGSLGTTDLTPIQAMYAAAPTMGIADGVDEVHKATVARRVLKEYRPHEGYFPTEYIPYKREEAWQKMQPVLDASPELQARRPRATRSTSPAADAETASPRRLVLASKNQEAFTVIGVRPRVVVPEHIVHLEMGGSEQLVELIEREQPDAEHMS